MSGEKRMQWLDILKFLGIFGIVLGHISTYVPINNIMYSVLVPLFFFASGIVYKPRPISEDIKRRAKAILVPYLVFGIVTLLYYNLFEHNYREVDLSFGDTLFGLFSGIFTYLEFNSPLWFLPCFFTVCVIYNIIYSKANKIAAYIFSTVLFVVYAVLYPLPHLPYEANRTAELMIIFAAGNIAAENKVDAALAKLKAPLKLLLAAVFFAASYGMTYYGYFGNGLILPCALMGIAALMLLSMLIEKAVLLAKIGRMTLLIMLIHGPMYRVLVKVSSMLMSCGTDEIRGNMPIAVLLSMITIFLCAVIYLLLVKIAPWSIGLKKENCMS